MVDLTHEEIRFLVELMTEENAGRFMIDPECGELLYLVKADAVLAFEIVVKLKHRMMQ